MPRKDPVDLLPDENGTLYLMWSATTTGSANCLLTGHRIERRSPTIRTDEFRIAVESVDDIVSQLRCFDFDTAEFAPISHDMVYVADGVDSVSDQYRKTQSLRCPVCGELAYDGAVCVETGELGLLESCLHQDCVGAFVRGLDNVWEVADELVAQLV